MTLHRTQPIDSSPYRSLRWTLALLSAVYPLLAEDTEIKIEAEFPSCKRQGDTSINKYDWASGGKAVWLRNAGDSITFAPDGIFEGYYQLRLRGRSSTPLGSTYVVEVDGLREPLRFTGEQEEVGHPVGKVGWSAGLIHLKPKSTLKISNARVWALVDTITLTASTLKEKVIEAESGLCVRQGACSIGKYEWASGGGTAWLNKIGSGLKYTVGTVRPGIYDLGLKVRTLAGLWGGYVLKLNGFGVPLFADGPPEAVANPAGQVGWLRVRLHLKPRDVIGVSHLRVYGMVDCLRLRPVPSVEAVEADPDTDATLSTAAMRNPALNPVTFLKTDEQSPLWLVKGGRPAASIVVAAILDDRETAKQVTIGIPHAVRDAAGELQSHIRKATGAELPILVDRLPASGNAILVGRSQFTDDLGIDSEAMKPSSFLVRTFPGKVAIIGRDRNTGPEHVRENGTLWGVCDFLERFVGIRWYYPGELGTVVPLLENLVIPAVHVQDSAHFPKRHIWRFHGALKNMPPRLAGDGRAGAHFRNEDTSGIPTASHTFGEWRKRYGKDHPEYFQMMKDGSRKSSQLCFSEPGVLKQLLQNLEDNPRKTIPVSPIDTPLKCQCERCLPKVDTHSFLSEYSQVIGEFLHKLAVEAKQRWPEKTVVFLPYQNYAAPPKGLTFPDNVVAIVCGMRTLANYKEPEIYADERAILDGWKKILKRPIAHWHYLCWPDDCTSAPFQFRHVMKTFFKDYGDSIGSFVDSGIDWSRKHLTMYLLCRLLWNPDFDVEAAFEEYCRLMYGKAAAPMRELFEVLTDQWEQSRWSPPLPPYHRISLKNVHVETFPPPQVKKLRELYDQALAAVPEDSLEAERIQFFGISLKAFFKESESFHNAVERRTLRVRKASTAPTLDGKLDDACWRDAEGGEFRVGYDADAPPPEIKTTVRAVWSAKGITFAFRLQEPDMKGLKANLTGRDEQVYIDDCIEVFLDPKGEFGDYFQIVVNAKGAVFDASSLADPYASWNGEHLAPKVHRADDHWSIELHVPFADLGLKEVKPGSFWYGNFTRSRWHGAFELFRFSTADRPPLKTSNLNMLHFGKIQFVGRE